MSLPCFRSESRGEFVIQTILFDLDDTLLDFHRSEAVALSNTLTHLGISSTDAILARYSAINLSHWERLERGEISREQVLTGRFGVLFRELGVSLSPDGAQAYYERQLSMQHFLIDGAQALLDSLKARYTLAVVSNGTAVVQDRRLLESGLLPYFRYIFISERVGYDKPSAAFFDACFAQMPQVKREECIIIGDSLTSDMLGGINADVRTCWYNPHRKPRQPDISVDYEISALEELPPLLEGI